MPKNKELGQKMGKRPKQTFLQEDIYKANRHMKRYSASLIREMHMKTIVRCHYM